MEETIDLTAFTNAMTSFRTALDVYASDETNELVRDACIQRFEFCYSLATKFLQRHLVEIAADPLQIEEMTFPSLIREGYTKGVLKNSWDQWTEYRKARNITSHTYDEKKAIQVMAMLESFYTEANFLLTSLQGIYEN